MSARRRPRLVSLLSANAIAGRVLQKVFDQAGRDGDWHKFSFIWLAAKTSEKEAVTEDLHPIDRVVSDPLRTPRGLQNQLCRPERVGWIDTADPRPGLHEAETRSNVETSSIMIQYYSRRTKQIETEKCSGTLSSNSGTKVNWAFSSPTRSSRRNGSAG